MKESIWNTDISLPEFPTLTEYKKTDVLIIGGGLAGILTAYHLQRAGINYILIEQNKIASGVTKNTTAKITYLHGLIYNKIIQSYGKDKAKMYLNANEYAISEYEKLCQNIDCDYQTAYSYTYSLSDRGKIEDEVCALNSIGSNAEFVEKTELPFDIKGSVRVKKQAQFNPQKFICEISRGLNIYENTCAREITPTAVITNNGKIAAKKIIVATHFPFINKHGSFFLKLYQHRSYVGAYESEKKLSGMYVDEDNSGMSFRGYNEYILIGGGGHRTGKQGSGWHSIRSFQEKYYPNASIKFEWATQDCITLDGIPYIGRYSKNTPDMYVATGFCKWGITTSMVAANILCDMVQDKKCDYSEVFSPSRSILKPQLFINGFESVTNLITPTKKRCPHLGCALKWNRHEHTWDCPCHGSRFETDGKLINNPATSGLKNSNSNP